MTDAVETRRTPLTRGLNWIAARARGLTIANIVVQGAIIATGAAVRLTDSGLGCSTWPQCEPGEFTPEFHDAASYHPFVEFGNRTMTGVLLIVTALLAIAIWRARPDMRWWGLVPGFGVIVQAVLGGILVHANLNPWLVAPHLWISAALVWIAVYIALRFRDAPGRAGRAFTPLRIANLALFLVVLFLGALTTGAGPHSGDPDATERLALDPALIARAHAGAVWLFLITLAVLIWLIRRDRRAAGKDEVRKAWIVLIVATLLQGVIGYAQYFTGLPIVLVELHLIGVAVLSAAMGAFWYLARPVTNP
ncbi:COX15/CtaA family protein [Demequina sp.]|uniref:COX15/CtaA family protein n=1 Tax=Demequina sp. TaxID=2050685 RepID=UPI003D0D228A